MKSYHRQFKEYIDDLARRKPSPGGGSAVCLIFCTGVSLIEKAINYSVILKPEILKDKAKNKKFKKSSDELNRLKVKIYHYIDKDADIFEKIMRNKGIKRTKFIKMSEEIIIDIAKTSMQVFILAKEIESGIKIGIISDFRIGLNFIKSTLFGCVLNLEANAEMFGRKSRYTGIFKRYLKKWPG